MKASIKGPGHPVKPSAIDLFSGCGGLTLGLKRAGFEVVAAVEIDGRAKDTYAANHADVHLYHVDIRELSARRVRTDLGLKRGGLGLLAGCPPCQGFSRMRTRNGERAARDPRNALVDDFQRFVDEFLPQTVMLENVPGLARHQRFIALRGELKSLGYEHFVDELDSADYGVPQRRRRLILLASRMHSPRPAEPSRKRMTVRHAFAHLVASGCATDRLHSIPENRSEAVRRVISHIPKDGGSRSSLPRELRLGCHAATDGFYDVYGRMRWDDVAPTITSGCSNPSKGRFLHPSEDRNITLREAALLQGFPRTYKFFPEHGKEAIALMIGNALPPPFIAAHAKRLRLAIDRYGTIAVPRL
jgi:DNA (cytosine-5)-methyltransferase 1